MELNNAYFVRFCCCGSKYDFVSDYFEVILFYLLQQLIVIQQLPRAGDIETCSIDGFAYMLFHFPLGTLFNPKSVAQPITSDSLQYGGYNKVSYSVLPIFQVV